MWDLVDNPDSIALIESFYNSGKPVAAVCHSPAVFHRVMYQGAPMVKGKRVTGFTNGEEEAVHLTHVVPFLVEDELKKNRRPSMRRLQIGKALRLSMVVWLPGRTPHRLPPQLMRF